MELKVWVDGIKRVVCGVTDNTSCQDIVIALAQAMGRTGRFTLIEKWRENERPLAPNECPLLVLQKWGEFANEVKLMLYESGNKKKQKLSEKDKVIPKMPDKFSHNFTPPVKTSEAVIRRSLTFSGGRKTEATNHKILDLNHRRPTQNGLLPNKHIKSSERVTSDGNSWSSSSSLSSQNSAMVPAPQHRRSRSSSHDRSHEHRRPSPQPSSLPYSNHGNVINEPSTNHKPKTFQSHGQNHLQSHEQNPGYGQNHVLNQTPKNHVPNHRQNHSPHFGQNHVQNNGQNHVQNQNHRQHQGQFSDKPATNVPPVLKNNKQSVHSSAFSPIVRPRRSSTEEEREIMRIPNCDIPVFTENIKSSHRTAQELEEYDLDTNFPDVVKETGIEMPIEEYHVPGGQGSSGYRGNRVTLEEEEQVKLLRLVTMQNERIKMQDTQLDIIDTEINSREQKLDDFKLEISHTTEEMSRLSQLYDDQNKEVASLDNGSIISEMEQEKQTERDIKREISSLRVRLEKCENNLHQFQTKVKLCGEDLEKEKEVLESDEQRRKEEEVKLEREVAELQKDLNERSRELDEKKTISENVEKELKELTQKLSHKTEELTSTEKELQRENLKFFREPQSLEPSKLHETNGEAVLAVLEGSPSPHVKRNNKIIPNPLTTLSVTKTKNGVWV